ncbi:MAG: helix-turn-helix transcriptional regulator [Actinobacteria bacterium]|nr:helix-turn-helix transcriptional regulator [Actinomycetota bacterium]
MAKGDVSLTDPRALRALAHPTRLAILDHLHEAGTATATSCGEAAGISASAASYHLRSLAKWGLVTDAGGGHGRERPWRAVGTGFSFELTDASSPAHVAAQAALGGQLVASGERWTADFVRNESGLDPAWQRASHLANKTLTLTPAEAEEIVARIEELLEPYGRSTRSDPPADARVVRMLLRLFPRDVP